ncbi:MAG: DUF4406 domain-containing protein [Chitinophagaceae bacterium]|nr:DUF4406 domain-containing protein [Chitinophagaceae bacterium]
MKQKRLKIYLSGRVTGDAREDVELKFGKAEEQLALKGYEVINPTKRVHADEKWDLAMRQCIADMMQCDALLMLPDWKTSRGATIEHKLAEWLNIPIYYDAKEL